MRIAGEHEERTCRLKNYRALSAHEGDSNWKSGAGTSVLVYIGKKSSRRTFREAHMTNRERRRTK